MAKQKKAVKRLIKAAIALDMSAVTNDDGEWIVGENEILHLSDVLDTFRGFL